MTADDTPFTDLPAALVEEALGHAKSAGNQLLSTFRRIVENRDAFRRALENKGLITHESTCGYPPAPTTCATDGSYSIERMLTADFAATAAVAVEGLTPPSETRFWHAPRHSAYVRVEKHHEKTETMLRAIMLGRELLLAIEAPHDLVMLDATLALPLICFHQAANGLKETTALQCNNEFRDHAHEYLTAYRTILESARTDKNVVALPKYSMRREIGNAVGWSGEYDDRGLLTILLQPGELTKPIQLEPPSSSWLWSGNFSPLGETLGGQTPKQFAATLVTLLGGVHVFYYKPHSWLPALRVEIVESVANNPHRLGGVLQGLKHQCATDAMLEPYPLYLADRMIKSLARAMPAFRQVAAQHIAGQYEGDVGEVFFAMHGYRTESGV
ncbi:DNA double-strand break repair nuclease NurA [Candidatus Entotheonella palauensis]|uniref:DNA double-strand break repair nuclease NurA n=1 Tax=Candidatus Entotheonella palauensis TaxID=93172 RepID=UPI000B7D0BA0|nr:DNA double-strand break repair nuclease NurA [Candidatus Entotheonella palauensis]